MRIDWERMSLAFLDWAEKFDVSPTEFSDRCEYSYQHAWMLLSGKTLVKTDTFGRIVLAYGVEAVVFILDAYRRRSAVSESDHVARS